MNNIVMAFFPDDALFFDVARIARENGLRIWNDGRRTVLCARAPGGFVEIRVGFRKARGA